MLHQDLDNNKAWFDAISDLPTKKPPTAFDEIGDYTKRVSVQSHDVLCCWDTSHHIANECVLLHNYQAHLALLAVLQVLIMLSRIHLPCTNLMPMKLASILLTTSHSGLCLDGFLLIQSSRPLK